MLLTCHPSRDTGGGRLGLAGISLMSTNSPPKPAHSTFQAQHAIFLHLMYNLHPGTRPCTDRCPPVCAVTETGVPCNPVRWLLLLRQAC